MLASHSPKSLCPMLEAPASQNEREHEAARKTKASFHLENRDLEISFRGYLLTFHKSHALWKAQYLGRPMQRKIQCAMTNLILCLQPYHTEHPFLTFHHMFLWPISVHQVLSLHCCIWNNLFMILIKKISVK